MTEEKTAYNKVLVKAGLTEVNEHLYYYQHLCKIQADVFQMPCLRQYPNRYLSMTYPTPSSCPFTCGGIR